MMSKKRVGLGRGLDALLASEPAETSEQTGFQQLSLDQLVPGKYQPRQHMDPETLSTLAESIQSQGIIQPIAVRPVSEETYEILAGERRWRAAQLAGLTQVPVVIHQIEDDQALMIALIENIQREDLNAIEEAQGIQRLIEEFYFTHQQAAEKLGRSRSAITNLLRLLTLPSPIQAMVSQNLLEMGHARTLLTLPIEQQLSLAKRIVDEGLSVRQAEALAQAPVSKTSQTASADPDIAYLANRLSDWLGAQATLSANRKGKGKLTIAFSNLDQLDHLLERLGLPKDEA